ncbi:MAG: Omp28-related outer membrane protein [Bacteroidales bacterium]|nr:Omp28-related outer membrane protein [Bacteroidales bacterium]
MKKLNLLLLCFTFFLFNSIQAQQVERDMVILEIGTGTWCTYCPGAAMGAEDLVANGCDVGVIEYHSDDDFDNSYSAVRRSYYGISSIPDAYFDGILNVLGGSHTQSMYPSYLPKYQQRKAIPSSFLIYVNGTNTGSTYNLVVTVQKVAACSSSNIKLQLALTESDIQFSWQGMSELNFVERLMAPNASGTTINLPGNTGTQIVNLSFTMDNSWVAENCELVAFLQDNSTKEILQGTKVAIPDLLPSQVIADFTASETEICKNDTVYFTDQSLNNPTSWSWSFQGGTPSTSTEQNPMVIYHSTGEKNVSLTASNAYSSGNISKHAYITVSPNPSTAGTPSGPADLCQGDTNVSYTTSGASHADYYSWVVTPDTAATVTGTDKTVTVDVNPLFIGEFTMHVAGVNNCGEGIASYDKHIYVNPLPLQPNMPVGPDTVDIYYVTTSSYSVTEPLYSDSCNWVLTPENAGTLTVSNTNLTIDWNTDFIGNAILKVCGVNDCGNGAFSDELNILVRNSVGISENNNIKINLFPNPNTGLFTINLNSDFNKNLNLKIYNSLGIIVFEQSNIVLKGKYSKNMNLNNLPNGVYFLNIYNENINTIKKIIIQK